MSQEAYLHRIEARNQRERTAILIVWAVLVCCVIIGSLSPSGSPLIAAIDQLQVSDKVQHFCAYVSVSFPPVIGYRHRRQGLMLGLSMFLLGILMELG